jgi:hypothetical protein
MYGTSDTAHATEEYAWPVLMVPLRPSPLPGIARSTTENAHHDAKRKRDGCWHVLSNRVRDEENDMEKVQK